MSFLCWHIADKRNNAQQQGNSYGAVLANRFPKAMKGCYIDVLLDMPVPHKPEWFYFIENAQGTWQLVYINASNNIGQPISADIIEQLTPGYTNALNTLINVGLEMAIPQNYRVFKQRLSAAFFVLTKSPLIHKRSFNPVNNIVHLVSLEGCESYLSPDYSPEEGQVIQLISLSSWSFICMPYIDQNFGQLLTQLMTNTQTGDNIPFAYDAVSKRCCKQRCNT